MGKVAAALGVGLWCALVVGTVDNLLRPVLIGQDTQMPDLLILLSTLGGLALFGVAGLVLGPIVGALFISSENRSRAPAPSSPASLAHWPKPSIVWRQCVGFAPNHEYTWLHPRHRPAMH